MSEWTKTELELGIAEIIYDWSHAQQITHKKSFGAVADEHQQTYRGVARRILSFLEEHSPLTAASMNWEKANVEFDETSKGFEVARHLRAVEARDTATKNLREAIRQTNHRD